MERFLRPDKLNIDPTGNSASKEWEHWKRTFESFLSNFTKETAGMKIDILINHVSPTIFAYISECTTYEEALDILDKLFNKPKNVVYARYILATRRQKHDESIDTYMQVLKLLAKDCQFGKVDAETNKSDNIRDAFITGLNSSKIRQRLLENVTLSLDKAYDQARSLEMAEMNSQSYESSNLNAVQGSSKEEESSAASFFKRKCFFCGGRVHPRKDCPALDSTCQICEKKGHLAKVCRSKKQTAASVVETESNKTSACIIAASPDSLRKATVTAYVQGIRAQALIDTGSSISFMDEEFFNLCRLKKKPSNQRISMASTTLTSKVEGQTSVSAKIGDYEYKNLNLLIVKNLCADLIIGHDILHQHSSLEFSFGGLKEPIKVNVCSVAAATVPAVPLFSNVCPEIKPVAIKSRRHSEDDKEFIKEEVRKLLADGIIEESTSPWRAQVLITKNVNHKKRLVIDYSQTINRYTHLDAYPLPNIEELVSQISRYRIFSAIDLQSAYHQVPILLEERHFTAFEALGNLYQFLRIPFGVTNGVSSFQRTIDWVIRKEDLKGTFAYLDDITICGKTQLEHDKNLKKFLAAAQKYGLTLNKEKSKFSQNSINILGYNIEDNIIKPDADRLRPLLNLPPPSDLSSLRRVIGMFAHYSKWILNFSEKVHDLTNARIFPLSDNLVKNFNVLKSDIAKSSIHAIDHNAPLTVETDASDHSIAATLSQASRPVAFFSRMLNKSEHNHSAIEKEAYAIVESLKKWRHFLIGKPFRLITDQRSVSFMFNNKLTSKIKNEKIQRWRLELAPFKYDIIYRPGKQNDAADALSRVCSSISTRNEKLYSLHNDLCHPGMARMTHWLKSKNLPYSTEEIKNMTKSCKICSEIKPRFYKPTIDPVLIKATSPMERLSIDFKGPVPSNTRNKYILTVIDEYSRFPFAFPCPDMNSSTVIKHLNEIFMLFGMPSYLHSDRGTCFISTEVKNFLNSRGIASSRTTPYNPRGNGQVERFNGTLWKSVQLALRSQNLPIENWEKVLNQALHCIRSLLCTATCCTPHERMFTHTRRSSNGVSIPTWLTESEKVLMRKFNRTNKYQPIVEEVTLLHVNPDYSYVRYEDGRETTVSNRHLAPLSLDSQIMVDETTNIETLNENSNEVEDPNPTSQNSETRFSDSENETEDIDHPEPPADTEPEIRRSARVRHPPAHLEDYFQG
ncbi:uncharacterized protein K02A2.6-like [Hyposmocoma kahamanoa]|uniref:uncharacterized protein K02A2.6-like n=1 Tax=Hyposmocoma kahamanoa TaxID=1477025 RepID=UPI000E6D66EA|nr:uncharacterized protein K02A2.6-like [Hyposmocoma kahamanoa]